MLRDISQFTRGPYDLLVIGGGINGAAIAHMAALNGQRVALLEKNDFASGTSSKSTKLIHGGLRYLENFELDLVHESLQERAFLLRDAPHLVKPLSFLLPVYEKDKRPLWMMKAGIGLYDLLCGRNIIEKHKTLTAEEVAARVPTLKKEGLVGGVVYYDAQMDDARVVLENVLAACAAAAHVANYVEVQAFIKKDGQAVGVRAFDSLGKKNFDVYAQRIVCAVGPWSNVLMRKEEGHVQPMVRTTKGVHVVCAGQICAQALIIPTYQDNRIFFIIPWMGNSLIGTTDTDYNGNPDNVGPDQEDVDYLFREMRRVLPDAPFKKEKIITMFAGLRPLVHKAGVPEKVSRKHVIKKTYSGVLYVMGGKFTTYRKIAEDCLKCVLPVGQMVDTRKGFPLYGSGPIVENAAQLARAQGLKTETVQYLMDFYGTRFKDVLALAEKKASLKERLCSCSPAIKAQVIYAVETELAQTTEDIIKRRLGLVYRPCASGECQKEIRRLLAPYKRP